MCLVLVGLLTSIARVVNVFDIFQAGDTFRVFSAKMAGVGLWENSKENLFLD